MQVQEETLSLWNILKEDLKTLFPQDVYQTWFDHVYLIDEKDNTLILGIPNDFAAIWIQDNYHDLLVKRLQMAAGCTMNILYKVCASEKKVEDIDAKKTTKAQRSPKPSVSKDNDAIASALNPKNTFENFVVGADNQLAHAACIAVANTPAKAYNPLFVYGDTGLGKTHLMHAVAHAVFQNNPNLNIVYVSTEKFTNEFISASQNNTLAKFRKRYRNVDILLIDDIHFLSGKERIQEEFFHTFNDLFEAQKQIILCSDRPASEIVKLENRLISRFQWGLVTDIQAPDLETRVAILSKKAAAINLSLPEKILHFLAQKVARNVRRMEGALNRVAGYVALVNKPIDIPTVERLLKDILQEEALNQVTIEKIQRKVADYFQIRFEEMSSKKRPAKIASSRQIAMYLCRSLTNRSLQEIGDEFGGRDHGTVIHACKAVENMMEQDESVRRNIEYLQHQLSSNSA